MNLKTPVIMSYVVCLIWATTRRAMVQCRFLWWQGNDGKKG